MIKQTFDWILIILLITLGIYSVYYLYQEFSSLFSPSMTIVMLLILFSGAFWMDK